MKPRLLILALAVAPAIAPAVAPTWAHAAASACWYEGGVLVAPAEVMGVAGDYVIDTGSPHTLLADTQAQGAGYAEAALTGPVRLAGVELPARPVAVAKLDRRFYALPTPVAGVIGADVLKAYVVDVSFAPCRIALFARGAAPAFGKGADLPLAWAGGAPAAPGAVSDGAHARAGLFTLATGADTPVRISDAAATSAPASRKPQELYPYGRLRPPLRALSFAQQLYENPPSGLLGAGETGGALGEIGAPALRGFRLRFDFPSGRLRLAKQKGPPGRPAGPEAGRLFAAP